MKSGRIIGWWLVLLFAAAAAQSSTPRLAADGSAAQRPVLEVWHGLKQQVGHLGDAQDDFNLLGNVSDPVGLLGLTYSLNGGPSRMLAVGQRADGFGDGRRLAATGDFNADVPVHELRPGVNDVMLTAVNLRGQTTSVRVSVERRTGSSTLPARIVWSEIKDPQEAGQYVDGQWALERGGLRTLRTGYDRIFLIGERGWQDYEVTAPITIHRVDAAGPVSGGAGVGLLVRFAGHVNGGPFSFPATQPKYGYLPFGAIGWLRWTAGRDRAPVFQFYPGDRGKSRDFGPAPFAVGKTYVAKMRCETLPDDGAGQSVARFSWKLWETSAPEPAAWTWQIERASKHALRRGGVALLAHHVDATFGNVTITPLVTRAKQRPTSTTRPAEAFQEPGAKARLGEMHYSSLIGGTVGSKGRKFSCELIAEHGRVLSLQVALSKDRLRLVKALRFESLDDRRRRSIKTCGNEENADWQPAFIVPEGRQLVGISGASGWYVDNLRFHFDDGSTTSLYGGKGGDTEFRLLLNRSDGKWKGHLRGFWGLSENAIEALGLIFWPIE